jgi:hypothetical protein
MLSISSKPPKGKEALYSLLANFHYQVCEKIGKRQVNNRTVLLHAQQDAAALAAAQFPPKKAVQQKKASPPVAPAVEPASQKAKPTARKSKPSDVEDKAVEVVVADPQQTFQKTLRKPTGGPRGDAAVETLGEVLDDVSLQRRLLTLVQVLDPVTTETLHKKLNDGLLCTDRRRIESALMVLARQGVLYFENGIAYFAG